MSAPEATEARSEPKKNRRTNTKLPRGRSGDSAKLGMFLGVFTPTLLTILGVIMYLRFGWMIGQVGLIQALSIVVIANVITLITAFSFSAIATNTRVGVGGAYFIISRSLGLELGGAIGLPLFLSQVFSVTLYAYGLAETLRFVWDGVPLDAAAFIIIIGVGAISLKGAAVALRSQIPIMALVGISILALAAGSLTKGEFPSSLSAPPDGESFWIVFAVFFPAVTGVMAGLGLSGDLEDPRTAIPRGSIGAGLTGFVVYLGIVVLLAMGADTQTLREDQMVWTRIAPLGALLIFPGLWGAIFSSAIGSALGAPRTLQALAADHAREGSILQRLAGKPGEEPVVGLVVSLGIALGAVFLGGLNAVAEVVSMFFLTVYGTVNLVGALETLSGDSTWRPRIRVPWPLSLVGGIACFAVMFLINPVASVAAIAIEIALWLFFSRLEMRSDWGDMRRDIYEALIRWALIRLSHRPMSARNWRPHVLVFADKVEQRLELVHFGSWLSQDRGVVTVCELVEGDVLDEEKDTKKRQQTIQKVLDKAGLVAFPEVDVVSSVERGMIDVVQSNGLAGIESNTILVGWPNDPKRLEIFLGILRRLERLNKSMVIGRPVAASMAREGKRRTIDVWWGGLQRNGDLMLLMAHLLTRNAQWRGAKIRVLSIASNELKKAETEKHLDELLPEARIDAETRVIVKPKESAIRDIIAAESEFSDVVFLGLATVAEGDEADYAARLAEMVKKLPTVFFVKNNSLFVGELVDAPAAATAKLPEERGESDAAPKGSG